MSGETGILSEFISKTSYDDLPLQIVLQAKRCILDFLGVALAGSVTQTAKILSEVLDKDYRRESTLLGTGKKLSCLNAALINGSAAHALELDDGCRYALGHPGAVVIPSALAMAEKEGSSGKDLVTSVVVGYETFIRISRAIQPSHFRRGFHTTGTVGAFAAAAASSKILKLDQKRTGWALGLAGSQGAGVQEFLADGSMSKTLHPGKAAHSGVLSGLLAQKGFTGPSTILEGENGFCRAMSDNCQLASITKDIGEKFGILDVYFKLHAACRHVHPSIDATLEILKSNPIGPRDVKEVLVRTYSEAVRVCSIYDVKTVLSAKMSLPYSVAVTLACGKAGPDEFTEQKIRDPVIVDLLRKIKIVVDEDLTKLVPKKRGAIVRIVTQNNEVLEAMVDLPKGEPEVPVEDWELKRKFVTLASIVLNKESVDTFLKEVDQIENMKRVDLQISMGRK